MTSFASVFIVNFDHISTSFCTASIANFEQVNASWVQDLIYLCYREKAVRLSLPG